MGKSDKGMGNLHKVYNVLFFSKMCGLRISSKLIIKIPNLRKYFWYNFQKKIA